MWLARDKNGDLALFNHKPIWNGTEAWIPGLKDEEWTGSWVAIHPNQDDYPSLKWEDGPMEVRLVPADMKYY